MYEKVNGVRKNSTVACGFSPIKIHSSDYPKQIIEVYVFQYNIATAIFY